MAGVFRDETSIYILANDVSGSTATANDQIKGEVRSFKVSGGEQEQDTKYCFGGDITIEKPRTPLEISMDISIQNTAGSVLDRWDKYKYPNGIATDDTPIKSLWVSHYTNSLLKVRGFNNIRVTSLETDMNAEEELMMSVTFKCNAQTPLGVSNVRTSTISGSTMVANANTFLNWS